MCMRYKTLVTLAVSALTILPVTAQAQVHVSLGGGFTVPNSEVKDHLGNGYNFNFGVEVKVTPVIGIEGLYSFNGLGDKRISIPVSGTPGGHPVPTDFFARHEHAVWNGEPRRAEAGRRGQAVRARRDGRLLPAHRSDDAGRGLRAGLLQSVVVRLLPGRHSFPSRTSSANAARRTSGWTSAAA